MKRLLFVLFGFLLSVSSIAQKSDKITVTRDTCFSERVTYFELCYVKDNDVLFEHNGAKGVVSIEFHAHDKNLILRYKINLLGDKTYYRKLQNIIFMKWYSYGQWNYVVYDTNNTPLLALHPNRNSVEKGYEFIIRHRYLIEDLKDNK